MNLASYDHKYYIKNIYPIQINIQVKTNKSIPLYIQNEIKDNLDQHMITIPFVTNQNDTILNYFNEFHSARK